MMGGRGGGSPASRQGPAATPQGPRPGSSGPTNGDRVVMAYRDLQTRPGEWIRLADIRDKISDMSRADQDQALRSLATAPGVHLIAWDNRNALDARDHAASLRFGGDETHAFRIDPR